MQRLAGASADGGGCLRDVRIERALTIADDQPFQLDIRVFGTPHAAEIWSVRDHEPKNVARHAVACLHPMPCTQRYCCEVFDYWKSLPEGVDTERLYDEFEQHSFDYVPVFRPITDLRRNRMAGRALARLELPKEIPGSIEGYITHPILLDGCFQIILSLIGREDGLYLPTSIGVLEVRRPLPRAFWCLGRLRQRNRRVVDCDLWMLDICGNFLARAIDIACKSPIGAHGRIDGLAGSAPSQVWQAETQAVPPGLLARRR
jgi:hypothetical protein